MKGFTITGISGPGKVRKKCFPGRKPTTTKRHIRMVGGPHGKGKRWNLPSWKRFKEANSRLKVPLDKRTGQRERYRKQRKLMGGCMVS